MYKRAVAYFLAKNLAEFPRLIFVPGFYLLIFTAVTGVGNMEEHNKADTLLDFSIQIKQYRLRLRHINIDTTVFAKILK